MTTIKHLEKYGTTREVGEAICRHPRTVERMARAGVFHGSRKLGKTWLIPWRSVQRYTRSAAVGGF